MSPSFSVSLPFFLLAASIVVLMLLIAIRRDHRLIGLVTMAGLAASLVAVLAVPGDANVAVTPLFVMDGFTRFYLALVLSTAFAVALLSSAYLDGTRDGPYDEYYLLLLLATLGAGALLASVHFASFFLGLETLSIALIGLIAYPRGRTGAVEAGLKYLVLGGVASAFLLFGIGLLYLDFGTMGFAAIAQRWSAAHGVSNIYADAGFAMLFTGIGFKLSAVPFHMWAPDIYDGAPAPVTGFVATVAKIAIFALLLRYFVLTDGYHQPTLLRAIAFVAILSMLAGNLLALLQTNVKRLLAYSSIAHIGYVLVALLAGGIIGIEAASYYLAAYAITTLGAFGVVALLSPPGSGQDADGIEAYRGLMWTRPWLATAFIIFLLSLAGLPPTMGFFAKVYVVAAGVGFYLAWPLAALVIGSVIGLYYYLRLIVVLVSPVPAHTQARAGALPRAGYAMLIVLAVLLVGLGAYPAPLMSAARTGAQQIDQQGKHPQAKHLQAKHSQAKHSQAASSQPHYNRLTSIR